METETQLRIRDEQILALQKEVTEVKDQLEGVETSKRRSLCLARERVEQWKKTQQQKPLPKKDRQLQTLMEGNESMTSDNQTETGPQVPLDQTVHLETDGGIETAIEGEIETEVQA
uniref:Uncharacterized protein n=1 Tax=Knipowitschia caucasica TaxID=637954 RepID=A0AAV2ISR0_KNICA